MITVCKGCPKRYPGCHGDCEWYKAERKTQDRQNEAKRNESAAICSVSNKWNYGRKRR